MEKTSGLFSLKKDGVSFLIKVTANAKKNQIGDILLNEKGEKVLKVMVIQVAEKGKANLAVIALLAKSFGLNKTQINLQQGLTSKYKMVHIKGEAKILIEQLESKLKLL